MQIKRRSFLLLLLSIANVKATSCSFGFSFNFEVLDEETSKSMRGKEGMVAFLNKSYGENNWEYSTESLSLELPDITENSSVVPITVGSNNAQLAGVYSELTLYIEKHIRVIDKGKYSREHLPATYYINDPSKNSDKAFNLQGMTYDEVAIHKVARFKLDKSTRVLCF